MKSHQKIIHLLSVIPPSTLEKSPEIGSPRPQKRKNLMSEHERDIYVHTHSSFEEPSESRKSKLAKVPARAEQTPPAPALDEEDYEQFVDLEINECLEDFTVLSMTEQPFMKKPSKLSGFTDKETSVDSVSYKF